MAGLTDDGYEARPPAAGGFVELVLEHPQFRGAADEWRFDAVVTAPAAAVAGDPNVIITDQPTTLTPGAEIDSSEIENTFIGSDFPLSSWVPASS